MDFETLIERMTPNMHSGLKRAVELGKWPDGTRLTQEQRELCMEAVIAYDSRFVSEENRVGFIDRGSKAEGELCGDGQKDSDVPVDSILRWADELNG